MVDIVHVEHVDGEDDEKRRLEFGPHARYVLLDATNLS